MKLKKLLQKYLDNYGADFPPHYINEKEGQIDIIYNYNNDSLSIHLLDDPKPSPDFAAIILKRGDLLEVCGWGDLAKYQVVEFYYNRLHGKA